MVMKKVGIWSAVILFAVSLAFAGCGKKEELAPAPAPAAPAAPAGGAAGEPGAMAPVPAGGEAAPAAPAESKPEEKKAEGAKTK
jgi:hypothetical protein